MNGKVLILSVPDTQEDILKKILKVVEGCADIEERQDVAFRKNRTGRSADFTSRKDGLSERAGNSAQPPRI